MDFIRISEIAKITTLNTENLIVDSVYQSSHKVGVYIEKSKIKEWLEMCARIEKLTIEEQRSLAMQLAKEQEYIELKSELAKLQQFIETELEK